MEKLRDEFWIRKLLNNDLPTGQKGHVPDVNYYDRQGKKMESTYKSFVVHRARCLLTTPIQMANMTAAIANRGYYYTPHIIKAIENDSLDNDFLLKETFQ